MERQRLEATGRDPDPPAILAGMTGGFLVPDSLGLVADLGPGSTRKAATKSSPPSAGSGERVLAHA